ncbi:hypothetical protein AaE_014312, partial [Aphanomyces astaci]
NSGRKLTRRHDDIETAIRSVPHHQRQTLRSVAAHSGIPKTSIVRHMKAVARLKARSSYVKPYLTEANQRTRLEFAMSFLKPSRDGTILFVDMHNYVHVDEKWFYLTKVKRRYYVYDDEELALRAVRSKAFITKVMFLAAVARPQYDPHTKQVFSGKVGVWPFVQRSPAARTSKNRPKGTIITVPQTVNSDVYLDAVLHKVVPAIKAKFPRGRLQHGVVVQQDNASPHRCVTTDMLRTRGVEGISIANQPANSPDFNVLDLGFFNSIQSLQHQKCTRTIEELIDAVETAFYELPVDTLSKTFITFQKVLEKSIEIQGSNDYKLPHMNKDTTIKNLSSFTVECNSTTYEDALVHLSCRLGEEIHLEGLVNSLE